MKKLLLTLVIFSSVFIIEQANAQTESLEPDLITNPETFFQADGRGVQFLFFIGGLAIYSMFVWYFYRFISKREIIPKFYLRKEDNEISKSGIIKYIATYVTVFPLIIFCWFFVLGYFIFIIAQEMPMHIAFFISMAVIGVVRIVSYFREDASKEVAKMVPFAILSIFLTSAVIYTDPNFIEPNELLDGIKRFVDHPEAILPYVLTVVMFEWAFRIIFVIKRKFLPVSETNLEEEIEKDVDERIKVHYKKMEDKEKMLEKKLDEALQKLKDSENPS